MKEKRTRRLGHTRTPNPLPLHSHCFLYCYFCKYPPKTLPIATGFKTRKCNLNAILRRFRSKRARSNKSNEQCLSSMAPPCQPLLLAPKWRRHSNRLVHIGSALSRSVVSLSRSVLCRGLSSCRAVELDTLTPRRMQSGGVLSRSGRELSSSCRAILSRSCRLSCQVAVEFPGRVRSRPAPGLNIFKLSLNFERLNIIFNSL